MNIKYIIAILISVGIFNSCSGIFINKSRDNHSNHMAWYYPVNDTAYGTYLAGRVAHIRQDYANAAKYYIKSINLGADEKDLLNKIYVLLATEGRIADAANYAYKAIEKGDESNFARFITMTHEAKVKNFDKALEAIESIPNKSVKSAIYPLFNAWILTGKNDKNAALKQIDELKKDKELTAFYYMHRGMINDYFGDVIAAQKDFDTIRNNENIEMSFRSLQIITNFYIRNNQQEKALATIKKYTEKNSDLKMFAHLLNDIQAVDKNRTVPIIDTPEKGLAEAIFNVGIVFRNYQPDIAQIFTSLALYLNSENDVAIVSFADLLENNKQHDAAVKQYAKLNKNSPLYYMGSLKSASILMENKNYDKAVKNLKKLLDEYPNDYNILFNLGEVSRLDAKYSNAIKYYNLALDNLPKHITGDWTVYYALGVAYEKNNQWSEAEKILQKALTISNRHPYILNYLGYIWLENNQNYNEALYMIFEAYQQNPESGHILDSLGWALYRMGKYEDATAILERAAEYLPANAIVCDHLGDLYWQIGRKEEARHQWQHALTLKEDAEMVDKEEVARKIKNGAKKPKPIIFNEALLVERIKILKLSD
ncbi:MAG: tetratricopeptide repeat protein [Alphaproteobacteria bacterium]|nr:tetratricopeptide repeat protein [Alphaproteobacteria bacterium]